MKKPRNSARVSGLEFAPAMDAVTKREVLASVVLGGPLSDEERTRRARVPTIADHGIRAWPGDVIVQEPASPIVLQNPAIVQRFEAELEEHESAIAETEKRLEIARQSVLGAQDRFRSLRSVLVDAQAATERVRSALSAAQADALRASRGRGPTYYVVLAAEAPDRIRFRSEASAAPVGG